MAGRKNAATKYVVKIKFKTENLAITNHVYPEVHLNYTQQFSPYHTENTVRLTIATGRLMFTKMIGIYCDNHMKHINKIRVCEKDAGFLNVTEDKTYILNNVFKGVNSNKSCFMA